MKGYSYFATHSDEDKPPIPYKIGRTFRAQSYHPPPPPNYFHKWSSRNVQDKIRRLHPVQLCLQYPPAPGKPCNEELQLKIIDHVRVKDQKNSQVVLARPLSHRGGETLLDKFILPNDIVTKFYDPLYYDFNEFHVDPFANCDAAFSHETLAYKYLQPLWGTVVPRYYGSYSVTVPLFDDATETRDVRAIFYEYVHGICLQDIAVRDYTQQQRQAIMRAIIRADSQMWQLDVNNLDLHPRNIILVSANEGEEAVIRIIDFDHCQCGTRVQSPTLDPLPREEVLTRWLDSDFDDSMIYFRWLVDWPWDDWLENEYAGNGP
ncbi:hypothetical protein K449DRAFT_392600 [Hypoxylon sp. EC38]|nr:hypothetical protein K449DRAFT_392600 [Hypoxylon sp. EC38]